MSSSVAKEASRHGHADVLAFLMERKLPLCGAMMEALRHNFPECLKILKLFNPSDIADDEAESSESAEA